MTLYWCLTVVRLGMKKWLTASVLMGGIASCKKIETEAEVEAEEVEVAWKLTTSTSLVGLKVYWFTYKNPVAGKSYFSYHDVFF